jgi:hypothetical protein
VALLAVEGVVMLDQGHAEAADRAQVHATLRS